MLVDLTFSHGKIRRILFASCQCRLAIHLKMFSGEFPPSASSTVTNTLSADNAQLASFHEPHIRTCTLRRKQMASNSIILQVWRRQHPAGLCPSAPYLDIAHCKCRQHMASDSIILQTHNLILHTASADSIWPLIASYHTFGANAPGLL